MLTYNPQNQVYKSDKNFRVEMKSGKRKRAEGDRLSHVEG